MTIPDDEQQRITNEQIGDEIDARDHDASPTWQDEQLIRAAAERGTPPHRMAEMLDRIRERRLAEVSEAMQCLEDQAADLLLAREEDRGLSWPTTRMRGPHTGCLLDIPIVQLDVAAAIRSNAGPWEVMRVVQKHIAHARKQGVA